MESSSNASWGTYNEHLRGIKFVIETKTFGLKAQTKLENDLGWNLKIFVAEIGRVIPKQE
jgi:hypothetical protein